MRRILVLLYSLYLFCPLAAAEESLSWQECIKEAAKNHPDLIASQEQVKQSQEAKKITASSLFPQVEAGLSASTSRSDNNNTSSASDSYDYGVSGSQLIFDGNKTVNDVRSASENINAAKQSYRFTSATVRFRLRSAFINLLTAQEQVRIAEEIYRIRRSNLELITLRYESGLEHKGALLTAEANLSQAKLGIASAKRNIEVAQRQLAKEMGKIDWITIAVEGSFEIGEKLYVKPDLIILAENNPSLKQSIAQVNSAEFSLRSAYGNFYPSLSGLAGASKAGSHWSPNADQWNLGLVLSMPVFEGGLRIAQVAQARALLNQLRANEESTRDGIVLGLEQSWAAMLDAEDNVKVQRELLNATEVRSRIAQAQYSTGFMTFDNWTIIEDNLVSAKTAYLNAQSNSMLAEASWVLAKGETLEYE